MQWYCKLVIKIVFRGLLHKPSLKVNCQLSRHKVAVNLMPTLTLLHKSPLTLSRH